jgi:hypothetical protein
MKVKYSIEQRRLLQMCKVPSGVIQDFNIKWENYIRSYSEQNADDGKLICKFSIEDQKKTVQRFSSLAEAKPHIIVINATTELTNMRRFMVPWFFNVVEYAKNNPKATLGNMPLWHYLDSSFSDELLDILRYRNPITNFNDSKPLIVIDGVATDSGHSKVEKLRDIINLTLDHVVIILLAGTNPFLFCKNKLGFAPKQFVVFFHPVTHSIL